MFHSFVAKIFLFLKREAQHAAQNSNSANRNLDRALTSPDLFSDRVPRALQKRQSPTGVGGAPPLYPTLQWMFREGGLHADQGHYWPWSLSARQWAGQRGDVSTRGAEADSARSQTRRY